MILNPNIPVTGPDVNLLDDRDSENQEYNVRQLSRAPSRLRSVVDDEFFKISWSFYSKSASYVEKSRNLSLNTSDLYIAENGSLKVISVCVGRLRELLNFVTEN